MLSTVEREKQAAMESAAAERARKEEHEAALAKEERRRGDEPSHYEKIGVTIEGQSRDALFRNGHFQDLVWYSLLADEYKNRRPKP